MTRHSTLSHARIFVHWSLLYTPSLFSFILIFHRNEIDFTNALHPGTPSLTWPHGRKTKHGTGTTVFICSSKFLEMNANHLSTVPVLGQAQLR